MCIRDRCPDVSRLGLPVVIESPDVTVDGVQDVHIHHVVRALPGPVKVATITGAKILDEKTVGGVVLEISPAAAEFLFMVPVPEIQQTVLTIADLCLQVRVEHGVQEGVVPLSLIHI